MDSRFTQIVIALVIVFFGFIWFSNNSGDSSNGGGTTVTSNHVKGNTESSVVLEEWGDFQCSACAAYYPVLKQVFEKYEDRIAFRFRHFPIISAHPNAFAASRAAEAASKQGKFFEMHDLLYENQTAWANLTDPLSTFVGYATQLGLDEANFRADYASSEVNDIVSGDFQHGNDLGVSATPTFYINGEKIAPNPGSIEEFEQIIENALNNQ